MEVIMKEQQTLDALIQQTYGWLVAANYSKGTIYSYKCITNQLKTYAIENNEAYFSMDLALSFIEEHYHFSGDVQGRKPQSLRYMEMLSDFKLNSSIMIKERKRAYQFPKVFQPSVEGYNEYRRSIHIKENSILRTQLYLERFFDFLEGKGCCSFDKITIAVVYDFIAALSCFSKQTAAATLRSVKLFLEYSFKNGFYDRDIYKKVPCIHYNKTSALPSVYTEEEVRKTLERIDLGNPGGKRDYAVILLIARLGLRAGDVANLRFENISWETNRINFYQVKTKKQIELPLLKDVGEAIIEYMKYGRPECSSDHVFVRHRAPIHEFTPSAIGAAVHRHLLKAGIQTEGRHHGSHALRHSLAGRLLENKIPLPVISEILGHSSTETTMAYLRVDINQLRNCALEVAGYEN